MPEQTTAPKPLDLAVLMAFGVRLHLFTRQRGEEVRAKLRGGLGKAHTPLQIAEWLEVSPGELEQLIRAVRKLPRDCPDADLVAAFRRRPTEEGLLAVGTPTPPPQPVPDDSSVSIGRDVFSDPALPTVRDPVLSPRKFEWGRAVDLWTRMSLLTPEVAADLLDRIGAQPIDSLTPAALAGWLGIHEATLEGMLRLAKTLPDEATAQAARAAFDEARQADPHDLGTIEFGINTPSSSFLKPYAPPEPVAPVRPSEDKTKFVTAPPPAAPPGPPSEDDTKRVAAPDASALPVVLESPTPDVPRPFGLDAHGEDAAIEALAKSLVGTGLAGSEAIALVLSHRLWERWKVELRSQEGPTSAPTP